MTLQKSRWIRGPEGRSSKLQPSPDPDFLWTLLALAHFMRLSLTKAAQADVGGARAGNPEKGWELIRR
jgi:hypothetical protein